MTDRDVCIVLNLITGIGYSKYKYLSGNFNNLTDILSADYEELTKIKGISDKLAKTLLDWKNKADFDKEIEMADKAGVKIITILDNEYPRQLKEIPDPPLCLYIRGKLELEIEKTIAVVGTRRITVYGREMTEFLVSGLSVSGFNIVSGLAYGVDAVSHKTALVQDGKTVAVLGGGLARLHPQDHLKLARDIVEKGGAVISEFPMEFPPNRKSFPMRNRIISGLSCAVLVTEAGLQSGSLITSNFALEQGRLVFAVPGNANSPMSKGCNKLIRDGAKLTENIDDILEEFEFLPGFAGFDKNHEEASVEDNVFELSDEERAIVNCIELEDKSIDNISMETQIPLGKALVNLQNLELKKIVSQLPGKRYKKK